MSKIEGARATEEALPSSLADQPTVAKGPDRDAGRERIYRHVHEGEG